MTPLKHAPKIVKNSALLLIFLNSINYFLVESAVSDESSSKLPSNRIVNGRDAKIEDYPHQLSLRRNSVHFCGASVLDTNWALTATHCVEGFEKFPEIFTLRIGSSLRSIGGEVIAVTKILRHPSYNPENMNFDVALLRTKPKMLRGDFVKPIKLPDAATTISDDTAATVTGWGYMSSTEQELSTVLKYTTVYTVSQSECAEHFKIHGGITDAMFCAAARATDACQGDSGGPIQANGILIGVVSWGVGCADPNYPGVYARLAYPAIRLWIRLHTHL